MKYSIALIALLFIACGYVPVASYSDKIFGEGVYVEITMDPQLPEASVSAKDAINLAILTRFNNILSSKQNAQSIIDVHVLSVNNTPVAYDANGFVSHYRATVNLVFKVQTINNVVLNTNTSGYYDYPATSTSALLIEEAKLSAVSNATIQALDKFISQMAYYGSQQEQTQQQEKTQNLPSTQK